MHTCKSQSGFTLIEVMIAMAVMAIGMYGLMTMSQNSTNLQSTLSVNAQIQDYVTLLEMQMANTPSTCTNLLVNVNNNTINPVPLAHSTAILTPLPAALPPLPQGVTLNNSVTLDNFTTPGASQTNWTAQLELQFTKTNPSNSIGGSTITRKLPITVVTAAWNSPSPPPVIISCGNSSSTPEVMNAATGHTFGVAYQNTSAFPMKVVVTGELNIGHGTGQTVSIQALVGAPAPTTVVASASSTNGSGFCSVSFFVPPGYFYIVNTGGIGPGDSMAATLASWVEWTN